MLNPKTLEAWYTLMAEAMRGTQEAQNALRALSDMSSSPEELNQWMAQFMPGAAPGFSFQADKFDDQLENWWRLMGVVPRPRYLELLDKCDRLQRKLNKAEETITGLRKRLGHQEQTEVETQKVMNMWSTMMSETLKAQTDWMQRWTAANSQEGDEPDDDEAPPEAKDSDNSEAKANP